MRAHYLLVPLALLLIACNKNTETTEKERPLATKTEKKGTTLMVMNDQYKGIEYQVGAFKIGIERLENKELKNYLKEQLNDLETLRSNFQTAAEKNNVEIKTLPEDNKKELYKLSIADAKDFDKIFVMYYKDFLNKSIKQLSELEVANDDFNMLKNKYGNILYEQKLYFDVL